MKGRLVEWVGGSAGRQLRTEQGEGGGEAGVRCDIYVFNDCHIVICVAYLKIIDIRVLEMTKDGQTDIE